MQIKNITPCIQVTGNISEVVDFYVEKLGLFDADYKDNRFYELTGYQKNQTYSERASIVFHTDDFDAEYKRLVDNGVVFEHHEVHTGEMNGQPFSFNIAYFSDPQGTPLSLEDGGV